MLQIEDRIALLFELAILTLDEFAIAIRQIDIGGLHLASALRPESNLLDISMRNVFAISIEILVGGRNLDTTLPTAAAKVVMCAGVVEYAAIDGQVIVVETRIHRTFCGSYPYTVLVLAQYRTATAAQTETDNDRLGIGSLYTEAGIALTVDHRILLSRLVHRIGNKVLLGLHIIKGSVEVLDGIVSLLGLVVLIER